MYLFFHGFGCEGGVLVLSRRGSVLSMVDLQPEQFIITKALT